MLGGESQYVCACLVITVIQDIQFTTVKCVAVVWIGHFGVCQRDSFLLVDGNGVLKISC